MSDKVHTHLTIGLRPVGECPACDQVRECLADDIQTCDQTERGVARLVGAW